MASEDPLVCVEVSVDGFADAYVRVVVEPGKQPLVLMLVAFLVTFLAIRASVRMIRAGVSWWPGNIHSGGVHVHHMVFGVVIMLAAGLGGFSAVGERSPWTEIFAALFGVGAALVLDEFALILNLQDVYWTERGRASVDAVVIGAAVCGLLLLGASPLGVDGLSGPATVAWWVYYTHVALNSCFVVVTLLKGKVGTGLIGVLIPLVAVVGAVRLARPSSPWAHRRYRAGSRKLRLAIRHEDGYRRRVVNARNRLYDLVAGRVNPGP